MNCLACTKAPNINQNEFCQYVVAFILKTFNPIYYCIGIDFGTKVSSFFFVLDLVVFLLMQSYIEWQKYWLKNKKRNISKFVTNIQNVITNNIRANSNQISINFINTDNNHVVSNNTQPNNIEDSSSKKAVENDLIFGNRFKIFFIPNTRLILYLLEAKGRIRLSELQPFHPLINQKITKNH
jgi:hypothetical protein